MPSPYEKRIDLRLHFVIRRRSQMMISLMIRQRAVQLSRSSKNCPECARGGVRILLFSSPSNLMLLSLYAFAVIFAVGVSWLFRRVSAQPNNPLNRLSRAYLIGGPNRAREVALFQLVTEGWIKPIESGDFIPRVFSLNEDITGILPLEREMLRWATKQIKFSANDALKRRYKELSAVEEDLIRSQLVLSKNEFLTAKIISLIPIGILALDGILHLATNLIVHVNEPRWVILVVASMAALFELANGSRHSTQLGSIQRELILKESKTRIRQSSQATPDGNPTTYDLLWKMGDQVLIGGLRSLGGTMFMKPSRLQSLDTLTKTGTQTRVETRSAHETTTASALDVSPNKNSAI